MLMRARMPADHDTGRTGDLSVSGPVRQLSRSGRLPPHCRRASADPSLGAPAPSPAQHPRGRGTSGRACQSRLRRGWSHSDALRQVLPARAPALPGMLRTGELPVSGSIRQPNRTDWNTPTTARQSRGSAALTPSRRAAQTAEKRRGDTVVRIVQLRPPGRSHWLRDCTWHTLCSTCIVHA